MALNFPDPNSTQTYTNAGITWTWNPTLGVWSTEGNTSDNEFLSKVNDDTAAGAITFEGQTTHEAGIELTGGGAEISSGFYGRINAETKEIILKLGDEIGHRFGRLTPSGRIMGQATNTAAFIANSPSAIDITGIYVNSESANLRDPIQTVVGVESHISDGDTQEGGVTDWWAFKASAIQSPVKHAAQNTYGFYSEVVPANGLTSAYNFYAQGLAKNFFAGKVVVGNNALSSVGNDAATNSGIFLATNVTNNATGVLRIMGLNQTSGIKRVYQTFTSSASADGASSTIISRIQSTGTAGIRIINNDGTDPLTLFTTASTVTNPQDISFDASALVKLLQPKTFEIGGANKVGFLAEDLKIAAPMTAEDDDDEGASYSPSSLIPILTKALQEALTRIEELESNTLQPVYATLADLPDASEHHGKTAHVHAEGALYFAHAGNWVKLQNA